MGEQVRRFLAILIAAATVAVALASTTREASSAESEASAIDPQVALARRLLDVAGDESKPAAARAIETARMALAARRDTVPDRLLPLLDQEARNLDTAERLLGISVDASNSLEQGIDIAKIATEWQAATLGLDLSAVALPVVPRHDLPSEAAIALIEGEGGELASSQVEELRRFDDLPTDARSALAGFIDAFVVFAAATGLAYANADVPRLEALVGEMEAGTLDPASLDITGPGSVLADLGIDLAPVFVARQQLLDTVVPLRDALTTPGSSQTMSAGPDFQFAPYLSLELDLGEANTYSQDFMLLIDVGGGDTYLNNAGGGTALSRQAATLVDLIGNDQYRSGRDRGINGGGNLGSDLLVDGLGSDTYLAGTYGTNGGAAAGGTGLLLDGLGPNNLSAANYGTNGGGELGGIGTLIDVLDSASTSAGNFGTNGGGEFAGLGFLYGSGGLSYLAGSGGTNGGGSLGGAGFLFDALGSDRYVGGTGGVNGGSGGVPGSLLGLVGGIGFLFDAAGSDTYSAGSNGVNGGGTVGVGMLVDAEGSDALTGIDAGVNGGGDIAGIGFLIDLIGNDTYTASRRATNGGGFFGAGLLFDGLGSDRYAVGNEAGNGGGWVGSGLLVDGDGDDRYTAGSRGVNGGGAAGTGLLLDNNGNDVYSDSEGGSGTDKTVIPKGVIGAQVDSPPPSPVPTTLPPLPPTTLPPLPPVVVVDFEDMSPCGEHTVEDPTLIEFWHSDPFTSPYSVCVLIHFPITFTARFTFDPSAALP